MLLERPCFLSVGELCAGHIHVDVEGIGNLLVEFVSERLHILGSLIARYQFVGDRIDASLQKGATGEDVSFLLCLAQIFISLLGSHIAQTVVELHKVFAGCATDDLYALRAQIVHAQHIVTDGRSLEIDHRTRLGLGLISSLVGSCPCSIRHLHIVTIFCLAVVLRDTISVLNAVVAINGSHRFLG